MDKSVNKKYTEFWNDEEIIKSNNKDIDEKSKKTRPKNLSDN